MLPRKEGEPQPAGAAAYSSSTPRRGACLAACDPERASLSAARGSRNAAAASAAARRAPQLHLRQEFSRIPTCWRSLHNGGDAAVAGAAIDGLQRSAAACAAHGLMQLQGLLPELRGAGGTGLVIGQAISRLDCTQNAGAQGQQHMRPLTSSKAPFTSDGPGRGPAGGRTHSSVRCGGFPRAPAWLIVCLGCYIASQLQESCRRPETSTDLLASDYCLQVNHGERRLSREVPLADHRRLWRWRSSPAKPFSLNPRMQALWPRNHGQEFRAGQSGKRHQRLRAPGRIYRRAPLGWRERTQRRTSESAPSAGPASVSTRLPHSIHPALRLVQHQLRWMILTPSPPNRCSAPAISVHGTVAPPLLLLHERAAHSVCM